ncbi:hypothetical protein CN625_09275 [Bacillus toyonensis]|nr:hypothetical protein CN625_09275 [Bacillus toyonensis]
MLKLAIFELNFTFDNDNYVNKLSIWTAYYIFCLAWGFSKMLAVPHRQQAKKSNYLQNEKINKIFILGCYKILKLMDMGYEELLYILIYYFFEHTHNIHFTIFSHRFY